MLITVTQANRMLVLVETVEQNVQCAAKSIS